MPGKDVTPSIVIHNQEGIAFNTEPLPNDVRERAPLPRGLFRDCCHISADLLNDGLHRVEVFVVHAETVVVQHQDDTLIFEVHEVLETRGSWYGKWSGAVRPLLTWDRERLDGEPPTGSRFS